MAKLQIKIPLIFIYNKDDAVRGGKMIEKERELERKNERERERERKREVSSRFRGLISKKEFH